MSKRVKTMNPQSGSQTTTTTVTKKASGKKPNFGQAPRAAIYKALRYRGSGFPEMMTQKLKYAEAIRHTVTAGFLQYVFSANGLFDPNITGSGHQPLYFDQLMAIYNHYAVISSHIKITPYTGATIDLVKAVYVDDDASGTTTATTVWERPGVRVSANPPSSTPIPSYDCYWKASNAFGKDVMSNDNLQGTATANPAEQSYFINVLFDPAAGTTTNVDFLYEIWYDVVFFERKDMTGS